MGRSATLGRSAIAILAVMASLSACSNDSSETSEPESSSETSNPDRSEEALAACPLSPEEVAGVLGRPMKLLSSEPLENAYGVKSLHCNFGDELQPQNAVLSVGTVVESIPEGAEKGGRELLPLVCANQDKRGTLKLIPELGEGACLHSYFLEGVAGTEFSDQTFYTSFALSHGESALAQVSVSLPGTIEADGEAIVMSLAALIHSKYP